MGPTVLPSHANNGGENSNSTILSVGIGIPNLRPSFRRLDVSTRQVITLFQFNLTLFTPWNPQSEGLRRLCWTSGQQAHLSASCGRFDGEFHYFYVGALVYSELSLYLCFVIGRRNNVASLGSSDVLQQFSSPTDVLGYLLVPFRCPDSHGRPASQKRRLIRVLRRTLR